MREVVDEAARDAAEHRLPLFLSNVFLQLDEPVRHVVEGVAQLSQLVGRIDDDALFEVTAGEGPCSARKREDRIDEASAPVISGQQHCKESEGDRDAELPLQRDGNGKSLRLRLLD